MIWQHSVSRRTALRQVASVFAITAQRRLFGRILGGVAFTGAVTIARPAHASVTAALAAGSIVANQIAAHNRRNTVAIMLGAMRQELRVAIEQLASLQSSVAEVYDALMKLRNQIDSLLHQQDVRQLQNEIMGVVQLFNEQLKIRARYENEADWLTERTILDLQNYLERLRGARASLRQTRSVNDPTAALVASSAAFLEINLISLVGHDDRVIESTIEDTYLPWLDAILDITDPESASGYTAAAKDRHDDLMKTVQETKIGKALGKKPGRALAACVGINDYNKSYRKEGDCAPDARDPHFNMKVHWEQSDLHQANFIVGSVIESRSFQEGCGLTVPEHKGKNDRLWRHLSLSEYKLNDLHNQATNIIGLKLVDHGEKQKMFNWGEAPKQAAKGKEDGYPGNKNCSVKTQHIPDKGKRLKKMRDSSQWTSSEREIGEFKTLLDLINLERARFAFGIGCMKACTTAREELYSLLRSYG